MKIDQTLRLQISKKDLREVKQILKTFDSGQIPLKSPLVQQWQTAAMLDEAQFISNCHILHIKLLAALVDYYEEVLDQIQGSLAVDLDEILEEEEEDE